MTLTLISRVRLMAGVVLLVGLAGGMSGPAKAGRHVGEAGRHVQGASPQSAAPDIPQLKFENYTLPNGLEVILAEDHRLPLVAVNLWYHVGPANEKPGRTGFAHLFEHMMFQSSKHVPPDSHIKLLEGAGASDINGTTDFDRTNYFATLPINQLELALWLESDRMGYLLDKVDQANLTNQQDVVRNERRQSVENRPYGLVEEAMFHELFPKGHPYYASVIGSHADIQAARLEDVQEFFKTFYAPNNASLAIVGDINPAATKTLVEKYFGTLKKGSPVPKLDVTTPPITAEKRAIVKDRVELPKVYMAWHTSPIFKPGDAELDIAASVLGGGKASRLFKKLVYEKQIAQNVSAQQYSLILGSVFNIEVTARPGHTAAEIEKALQAEIEQFRSQGPDASEVERARNTIEARIVQGLETLGGFGGVADRLNSYNHYLGTPDYLRKDIQRYRATTPEAVKRVVQAQLKDSGRVVIHGVPGEPDLGTPVPTPPAPATQPAGAGAASINADEPWRKEVPKPGPAPTLALPVPQTFTLANGLTVIYTERPGLPVVAANLVVRTGSEANPADKPGLANFTAAMLDEGTAARSALKIADDVAQIGASLTTGSTMDASSVTTRSLKKNFAAALDLVSDVVLHPSFPADEIERQRKSRLASLVQQRENPQAVVSVVMASALYGASHPYGFAEIGTEASNKAITREDMAAFWKQNFVPNNAALVVAGSITRAELQPLVEKAFGAWQPGTPAKTAIGPPATTQARIVLVDKPGAQQTQVRVATIGAPRSTPDYDALEVLNNILGGLFSSRINLNLREQHGYTYGAFSFFSYRRGAGPFLIGSGIRTDVTGPAVSEIFKEVKGALEKPVTPEELTLSKESIVRSLPGSFETSPSAAGTLSNLYVYDLGLDYYAKLPARVNAVTGDIAQQAARKYLVPDKLVVIAVGDRAKIEPELKKLGLGALEVRDTEGRVRP